MEDLFFITGTYRSGTTLLEKLLSYHPEVVSAEQPLPTLFIYLKQRFFEQLGIEEPIPLGHLFYEKRYEPKDFWQFLENYRLSEQDIQRILALSEGFDGIKTRSVVRIIERQKEFGQTLAEFYRFYINRLANESKPQAQAKGSKEIVAEEFIEYLLRHGVKVILIIRNIKDVLNSASFGKGKKFIGANRPSLFTIRVWRKSVAFGLKYREAPGFLLIKYEDLVSETERIMQEIYDFLGISAVELEHLLGQLQSKWVGNSSFGQYRGISTASLGKYRSNFSAQYIRYIETLTYPELKALGYQVEEIDYQRFLNEHEQIIDQFQEPFQVNHHAFDPSYSTEPENRALEKQRIKFLTQTEASPQEQRLFFIFPEVYHTLKRTLEHKNS